MLGGQGAEALELGPEVAPAAAASTAATPPGKGRDVMQGKEGQEAAEHLPVGEAVAYLVQQLLQSVEQAVTAEETASVSLLAAEGEDTDLPVHAVAAVTADKVVDDAAPVTPAIPAPVFGELAEAEKEEEEGIEKESEEVEEEEEEEAMGEATLELESMVFEELDHVVRGYLPPSEREEDEAKEAGTALLPLERAQVFEHVPADMDLPLPSTMDEDDEDAMLMVQEGPQRLHDLSLAERLTDTLDQSTLQLMPDLEDMTTPAAFHTATAAVAGDDDDLPAPVEDALLSGQGEATSLSAALLDSILAEVVQANVAVASASETKASAIVLDAQETSLPSSPRARRQELADAANEAGQAHAGMETSDNETMVGQEEDVAQRGLSRSPSTTNHRHHQQQQQAATPQPSLLEEVWLSIFTPGMNPRVQGVMHGTFIALFLSLSTLFVLADFNLHVLFLLFIAVCLYSTTVWFLANLPPVGDDMHLKSE